MNDQNNSPLETYAEAKRSGTHPETLKNWPDKPDKIAVHTPTQGPAQAPAPKPTPKQVVTALTSSAMLFSILHFILSLLLLLAVLWIFQNDPDINGTAQLLKEAPPQVIYKTKHSVRYKIKTKVQKVYIAKSTDEWRRRYCYEVGNWDACLAYKDNLPLRARVGRTDLY